MRSGGSGGGHWKVSLTYSRPCRNPQAAATYTSPHWTTLRRRSLVQVLSASRSAGVSVTRRPPWRRSVAASDPVAGVNGRVRQAQSSLHRPRGGCQHRLFGPRSRGERDHRIGEAQPAAAVAGSDRESASWESGNLGSCRAFADSPGCQDSRFSVPRPGGDLGGRDRGAEESVRGRCARVGPRVPRSGRVARGRGAAMASPMARPRASPRVSAPLFSGLTPQGAFREAPIDRGLELEESDYAEGFIELIRDGKNLPDRLRR